MIIIFPLSDFTYRKVVADVCLTRLFNYNADAKREYQ